MIRAITFDFWCTLFMDARSKERQQLRIQAMMKATGKSEAMVDAALKQAAVAFDQHHRQKKITLTPQDAVCIAAQELGVELDSATTAHLTKVFATAILQYPPVPIEDALAAVKMASEQVPVGVVCDSGLSPGSSLRPLLEQNGFMAYFKPESIIFSDEVGVSKPQALMFETAAQRLGVAANELLHIGDLEYSDIDGAKNVGARSALFTGYNDRYLPTTSADYVFKNWREFMDQLPDILGS